MNQSQTIIFAAFENRLNQMRTRALLSIFLLLIICSCKKTETPAFLHIESIELEVLPQNVQGTDDHNITDAWVYLNDDLVGIYEVPATVPIISEGPQKITIIAGIMNNGIQSARIDYPFYDAYSTELNLIAGDTIDFSSDTENTTVVNGYTCPVVEYFNTGLIFWNEGFEGQGFDFAATNASQADFALTNDPGLVFNYNPDENSTASGLVTLTTSEPYFEIRSTHEFSPIQGQRVYLELNYRTDCPLQIGVYENAPNDIKVYGKGIFPKSNWSKIYIELSNEVAQQASATSYSIFIEGALETDQNQAQILIDNVKLVYAE